MANFGKDFQIKRILTLKIYFREIQKLKSFNKNFFKNKK